MTKTKTTKKTETAVEKPVEKFPELRKSFNDLQRKKEALQKKSEPLYKERQKLLDKIQPLEVELREINKKIQKIERPHLGNLDNQISAIARAMGGRSMRDVDTPPASEEG